MGGGYFQIVSVSSGRCLDVNLGQINENGANVQPWSCSGQPNQQWKLARYNPVGRRQESAGARWRARHDRGIPTEARA